MLVHGLGEAGVKDFYPLFPELARKRHVVAFDLPGFGRSGRINTRYAPDRYAAVLFRVIEAYGDGQQVDVLGHSMGGAIAMLHAASYPRQVRRLVVVDAAGILHREAWFGHAAAPGDRSDRAAPPAAGRRRRTGRPARSSTPPASSTRPPI